MKFMKLGSKPDTFYTHQGVRSVSCEVYTDLIIQVQGTKYSLHKNQGCVRYFLTNRPAQFPLLSKCLRLQKLYAESQDYQTIQIPDFPGGPEAFELCAKFCYGITITISARNLVIARCAAEYLQMTEGVDKGNLAHKVDVFFTSCLLHGWKDSILTLQTTKSYSTFAEDVHITSKCIEAISSKVLLLSKTSHPKRQSWWGQDISELCIDLYWRTMIAIKSGGKVPAKLIGDALQVYASRWFAARCNHRLLLEAVVSLLPAERGTVSCGFLLKLLKAATKLGCSASSKVELARRAALQLDEANVKDLLIPLSNCEQVGATKHDVDIVMSILDQFLSQAQSPPTSPLRNRRRRRRSKSAENIDHLAYEESRRSSSASHCSKRRVAKLIDGYLQQIAQDENLPLAKMITIAESIPSFARVDHDHLYYAIDTYLKAHPKLSKSERKRLCRILDCKKMSMEACMEAAKNELLPLRVLVQVLFHEQSRSAAVSAELLPPNIKALLANRDDTSTCVSTRHPPEDQWSVSGVASNPNRDDTIKLPKLGALHSPSTRPKGIFSKLLSLKKGATQKL